MHHGNRVAMLRLQVILYRVVLVETSIQYDVRKTV